MADLSILGGATSQSILVDLYVLSTGASQTGLVYNSTGLTAYYSFAGTNATSTSIALATLAAVNSAYSSGGFKELDATNMPGIYRFDIPNAAIAASKGREVIITFNGYSGMAPRHIKIELTGWDNQDAVHGGMSALPNTACTTNASLLTSGTGTDQLSVTSGRIDAGKILGTTISTPATAGILDVNVKNMNNVAATSITTINANQGTTQPLNFTGTAGSALVKSDMVDIAGSAVSTSTAQIGVNAVNIGGTSQTGRDIGSSVLLSAGTGAGQLDFTSGVVKANLAQILGTALTETAGQIAAAFKQFFNIASPTSTMNTITTVTTATNLTNAPTAGDFTATMKTSLNNATPTVLLTSGTGTGQVTLSSGILTANVNGDLTSTMKTSVTTACTASTPTAAAVTGAVGSVTGNVGGNVTGSVGSVAGNVTGSVGSVTSGVTVTTNNDKTGYGITSNRKKGATATIEILMRDSTTGAPKTGLTVAMVISKDGGAAVSTTNSVTEIGLGQYQIVLTATEMTANNVFLQATATGAITFNYSFPTVP
jgi:hypothetical protein